MGHVLQSRLTVSGSVLDCRLGCVQGVVDTPAHIFKVNTDGAFLAFPVAGVDAVKNTGGLPSS